MKLSKWWINEKIELFKNSYCTLSKEEILKLFPNYNWRTLQNVATHLKIKKKVSEIRKGKIDKLFNESLESFYWLGLIVTDGSITKDGTLKIDLCSTDYFYLKQFSKFLETDIKTYPPYKGAKPNSKGICRVKVKDIENGSKLRGLLGIENKKTYNPVNIEFIKTREQLISFLCGYIDGDGTISKEESIRIDAHKNYESFFNDFGNKLIDNKILNKFSITKYKNMVRLNIGKIDSKNLKTEAIKLNLPVMKRKWSRIV